MVYKKRKQYFASKIILLCTGILLTLLAIEVGYRLIDPFPYISPNKLNHVEHGNLSEYDPILGWKGVPRGKAMFITENISITLLNNSKGFRDLEHNITPLKPAIVLLGDSFTWGYEIEFENMFANLLREKMPDYEIFNLSHRGYGTDQEYIVFKNWEYDGPLELVVLMFSENDVSDNNSNVRYEKPKPKYIIENENLILTRIPVPNSEKWKRKDTKENINLSFKQKIKALVLKSHLLHEVYFRYKIYKSPNKRKHKINEVSKEDPTITLKIISELKKSIEAKGAQLVIFFIPSKKEIEGIWNYEPYQNKLIKHCEHLELRCINLAPDFKNKWQRTYYRYGTHWNSYGNKIAAESIYNYLNSIAQPRTK